MEYTDKIDEFDRILMQFHILDLEVKKQKLSKIEQLK